MEMKQVELIDCFIKTLGLDDGMTKGKFTPADSTPLVTDTDWEASCGYFCYSTVVEMLMYLSGHTRPHIVCAVNYCAMYLFCPTHLHQTALKRIGRYLKATRDQCLIWNPNSDICKLDCYPDAAFSGIYQHVPIDAACVKNGTGFVITFANCLVYWASKLQTMTALSTMEP